MTWGKGSVPRAGRTRGGLVVAALGASFGLVVGLVHCASPTEIVVEVWSDACGPNTQVGFTGASSLAELRTRELTSASPPGSCPLASGSPQRVGRMVLSPSGERDATVAFEVVTRPDGLDPSSCGRPSTEGCIVSRRQLPFVPRSTVTMRVDLRAACVGVVCGEAETCVRGSCERADTRCEGTCDEEQLVSAPPVSDAGLADADASRVPRMPPVRPPARPSAIVQIVAGTNHTCVRWNDDQVTCWGSNVDRRIDPLDGSATKPPSVVYRAPAGTNLVTIGAGGSSTCVALSAAPGVQCWGGLGVLFPGQSSAVRTVYSGPTEVPLLVEQLALGLSHACARDAGGRVSCWGDNSRGQYTATAASAAFVTPQLDLGAFSTLATSPLADFVCGVRTLGGARCFGALSLEVATTRRVETLGVSVGQGPLVCVTQEGGAKACNPAKDLNLGVTAAWSGAQDLGHLDKDGVVTFVPSSGTPVKASRSIPGARLLAVGEAHQCVVVGEDKVRCWGDNRQGEVNGTPSAEALKADENVPLGR